jgi:hypothetical protein
MEYYESKYSKQYMKLDPLTSAYLKVINENASNGAVDGTTVKPSDKPFGDKSGEAVKPKNTGLENAQKDLENVEEAPSELQGNGDGALPKELKDGESLTLKKVAKESKNPFDALYNKIISEDSFDFSSEDGVEAGDDFGGPEGIGSHEIDEDDEDEVDGDEDEDLFGGDEDEESEDEHEDLESLVSQLKDLVAKIEMHLGHDEESEEGDEEGYEFPEDSREGEEDEDEDVFGDEDEDEDENLSEESVDIEEFSDSHGLELANKSKYKVDGLKDITIKKKKGSTPKGKKPTGRPEEFKNESGISKLQAKGSYNVGAVKLGSIFNQGGSGSEE